VEHQIVTVSQFIANALVSGGIYSLIALGFSVIYGTVRFFHFAHGVIYALGAYLSYSLIIFLKVEPIVAILIGAVICGIIGVLSNHIVYRPIYKSKAPNITLLIASFGLFIFLQNAFQLLFGEQILVIRRSQALSNYYILGAYITVTQLVIIFLSIIIMLFCWLVVHGNKTAKAIRAVADDPIGGSVSGIAYDRMINISFFVGSLLAGIAGACIAYESNIQPTMGMNAILKGIIASIIGGIGSIPGAVLGGYLLGLLENTSAWIMPAGWKDAISFLVLIVFLVFRPNGIIARNMHKFRI